MDIEQDNFKENIMKKQYRVEVRSKFPTWNERAGIIEVFALSGKEAISKARKIMARDCAGDAKVNGPTLYRLV